jgi:hypothetical protein
MKTDKQKIKKVLMMKILVAYLFLSLSGCALLGTAIQLAPLAAIFVYYSAPSEIKDSQFACIKTIEYYRQNQESKEAVKTKSEHYICLVDIANGVIEEVAQLPDNNISSVDEMKLYFRKDKVCLISNEFDGTWQVSIEGGSLKKISNEKIIPAGAMSNQSNYAFLPLPEIREIPFF